MEEINSKEKYNKKSFYNEVDFVSIVSQYAYIYLYGAGYVGNIVERRLAYHNIVVKGFVVSKIEKGNEYSNIFPLNTIEKNHETMIVVTVTNIHRKEIIDNLEKNGFYQYVIISDKLILTMERLVDRRLHFQTHLVEHCNLKCRGCYHFSSLAKEEYLDLNEYESDLQRLSKLFFGKAEEILLLGGEPLLHPQINYFLEISRKYFPIGKIKVLTNGILLLNIEDAFFKTLDKNKIELWVTKYPVNFDYDKAVYRAKSFGIEIHYFTEEEVRSLGSEPLDLSGKRDYKNNFYHCYRANECVDLKHGRLYPCIIPAEVKPFCDFFNIDLPVSDENSVDIYAVRDADELLNKMEQSIPFCRFCNREDVQRFGKIPWSTTNYEITEWTE